LTKLGCVVTVVDNGRAAVQLFQPSVTPSQESLEQTTRDNFEHPPSSAYPFDLILMDGNMPILGRRILTH